MKFRIHDRLEGAHAFLSPSRHTWVGYDETQLETAYCNWRSAQEGTELHELAASLIRLKVKLPKNKNTLNMYVNDGIGFRMTPEVCLFYSFNAFGTADTISFHNNFLRIHDLKNGKSPTSMQQLRIYAALFCLEYGYNPKEIDMELRIYQSNDVKIEIPDPDDILYIMDKIIICDKRIDELKE